jgi:uncharacterized membrane protein YbhN (UPF0104 family)
MSRDKATFIVCATIALLSAPVMLALTYLAGHFGAPMKATFFIILAVFFLILGSFVKRIEMRIEDVMDGKPLLQFNDPQFAVSVFISLFFFALMGLIIYVGHSFGIPRGYVVAALGLIVLVIILLPGSLINELARKFEKE